MLLEIENIQKVQTHSKNFRRMTDSPTSNVKPIEFNQSAGCFTYIYKFSYLLLNELGTCIVVNIQPGELATVHMVIYL